MLFSPGVASIIVFRSNSASILRIVEDDDSEECQRSTSYLSKLIKNDRPAFDLQYFDTRISLNESLKACRKTLVFLLAAIEFSPSQDSTMLGAMVGHIVTGHYRMQQDCWKILSDSSHDTLPHQHANHSRRLAFEMLHLFPIHLLCCAWLMIVSLNGIFRRRSTVRHKYASL